MSRGSHRRLGDRLTAARHRNFVGRTAEIALFGDALAAQNLPFHIFYVFGPGGVGKTALLGEFARLCRRTATSSIYLDGRDIDPSPESFLAAVRSAMGIAPRDDPLERIASLPERHVLTVDTYEAMASLDGWLRDAFLPQLPEDVLVVLAGRDPPSTPWRSDPGWQSLVRVIPLRNLSRDHAGAYLVQRNVPAGQHTAVLNFANGHPLALSLVADLFAQDPATQFHAEEAPDLVATLLHHFVQKVPGPAHRTALEACALVRVTTEGLLGQMLAMPDVNELFEWLRGLSFIESGQGGLFPHDLAREALATDLRWRNPDWFAELHGRARAYHIRRVQETHDVEQQAALIDLIFLHRDNQAVRPFFELLRARGGAGETAESGAASTDLARPGDMSTLIRMVARHEGDDSAKVAERWLVQQPQDTLVFRESDDSIAGFVLVLALDRAGGEDIDADPAAKAAWDYLQRQGPLRAGERATVFRFWMASEGYQSVSLVQGLVFVEAVRHYLTTPGLAVSFFPCADPDFWAPMFAYADIPRAPEADFEIGGRRYGVYAHDWRSVPPMVWLDLLAEREVAAAPLERRPESSAEPLVVLSEPDFAEAVRDALRSYDRLEALRSNPLVRSRIVLQRTSRSEATSAERTTLLRELILEAAGSLRESARDAKLYRALDHTYLHPAPTQEAAAELLDLPFSTYRRHLRSGIARITDYLWSREIGAPG